MNTQNNKKTSLATIFIGFFSSFLILFIIVIMMSYYRLNEYKASLKGITNSSIPKIINSSSIFTQVNELIYLTEKLKNSNSQAIRRIVYNDILNKLLQIDKSTKELTTQKPLLKNQLEVIKKELFELNLLIETRLSIDKNIELKIETVHNINNEVTKTYKNNLNIENKAFNDWRLKYSEIVNLTYEALTLKRLNQLRQTIWKLEKIHDQLLNKIEKIDIKNKKLISPYCEDLNKTVFEKNGLLELKIEQLRINGRAIGRGNFVNNLLSDFSSEINFNLIEHTNIIIAQAKQNSTKAQNQVNSIFYLFIFSLVYLIIISYYLSTKVVNRLIKLNDNVKERIKGNNIILEDNNNDEIAHLSYSFNYYANKINEQKKELKELSLTDGLTNLANRRFFDIKLSNELNLVKRDNNVISLLLMDIDYFKLFNDNYGHLAGDECLQKISLELKKVVKRDLDLVARYGGEEFACILFNTNIEDSKLMAQKIINAILNLKIPHKFNTASKYITISIGITTTTNIQGHISNDLIISQADKALYEAKRRGKNCFVHFEEII